MMLSYEDFKQMEKELSPSDVRDLESLHEDGPKRYMYYRKHWSRWGVKDCYDAAVAWALNTTDQSHRRKSHGTGAV